MPHARDGEPHHLKIHHLPQKTNGHHSLILCRFRTEALSRKEEDRRHPGGGPFSDRLHCVVEAGGVHQHGLNFFRHHSRTIRALSSEHVHRKAIEAADDRLLDVEA